MAANSEVVLNYRKQANTLIDRSYRRLSLASCRITGCSAKWISSG